jgi:trigger factor
MDITLDKKSTTEALIKISLKETDYQPKVEQKVKDYSKKAEVKGFRKGKVPKSIIKNLYGKSILVDEINHLISHSLSDYIRENKIEIIGEPIPNREQASSIDWDVQKDFEFEYNIGMVDDFKVDLNKKMKVNRYVIKVDKEVIAETIENLKDQYGSMSNPETSQEGDSIYGEFKQVEGEIKSTGLLDLGDLDKKIAKPFIGLKSGDKVTFDIVKTLKDESAIAQLLGLDPQDAAGVKGEFELAVKNINRKVPAEINQEFFDRVFGKDVVTDEKVFLEKIEESIAANYQKESAYLLERDLRDYLVKKTKIATPNDFLKDWLLVSNEGKVTKEQIEDEFDLYLDELKWSLIRNKLTAINNIKIEETDIKAKARLVLADQFGGPAILDQLGDKMDEFTNTYLQANDGQNYTAVYNQVLADKIYAFVKDAITISEKKVSLDEFRKLASPK